MSVFISNYVSSTKDNSTVFPKIFAVYPGFISLGTSAAFPARFYYKRNIKTIH